MKKLIAILLCVSICFSGSLTTLAENNLTGESVSDTNYEEFKGSTGDVDVNISAPEGAFPEGTTVDINKTDISAKEVSPVIEEADMNFEILETYAADITFKYAGIEQQPKETVSLEMELDADTTPADANMLAIVHMGEDGPELVATKYLSDDVDTHSVVMNVNGFSSYVAVYVNDKYQSQKMKDVLAGNSRYSIKEFPVDLFDYDPVTINNALNSVTSDGNGFHFTGYGVAGCSSNNGINNSASEFAKQGILQNTLQGGLPIFKYLNDTNAGLNTAKVLFSANDYTDKKTVYNDIPFEFIYDNQTGYYEYKSSANHAQLNKDENKIELYADTLSTENAYVETIDLSTATGISDYTNWTATSTSYKATASDSNNNSRVDAYVSFKVTNQKAADIGKIYVKAKIPASVGTNKFQLFFDTVETKEGMNEYESFISEEYTANGDWIEFVVDTSDNEDYWTGTIQAIRIDLFDSNKGNVDHTGSYPIEIAQISLIKKDYDAYATRGGFYPFSEIEESFVGNNTKFNYDTWAGQMQDSSLATARASRSIFNPAPSSETLRYNELAYGTVMEFDFYIPVDKPTEPLTYYFNGDDDLWVFVDNQLVLDIGGGHGAITGSVNFTTGAVKVDNAVTVTGYNSGATSTASEKTDTLNSALYSPGKHTMKVFYLERGGSVSNCYMKFNLPQTPTGSVVVSKEVQEVNDASLDVLRNEEFTFTIETQNKGANGGDKSVLANTDFFIITTTDNKEETTEAKTDANGQFKVKHNQRAVFNIDENHEVTVTEIPKDIVGYSREEIHATVNGTNAYSAKLTTLNGQESKFEFVNKYKEQEATITYIPINPEDCPDDVKGTVELSGQSNTATYAETGVSEDVLVRTGTPVGSVATDSNALKFEGWYLDEACTNLVSNNKEFHPVKPDDGLWKSIKYYAKFDYRYGHLTISKTGISNLDNHIATLTNNKEQQSTLYSVTGTSHSGEVINLDVVIVGNNSVTIKDLPAGNYLVKEKADWSWRYEAKNAEQSVTITNGITSTCTFENERIIDKWLSGDSYCENKFGMKNQ